MSSLGHFLGEFDSSRGKGEGQEAKPAHENGRYSVRHWCGADPGGRGSKIRNGILDDKKPDAGKAESGKNVGAVAGPENAKMEPNTESGVAFRTHPAFNVKEGRITIQLGNNSKDSAATGTLGTWSSAPWNAHAA